MDGTDFLIIDDDTISLKQAINYLQASGKLGDFVGEIMRQYVIEQELLTRSDIEIHPAVVEQSMIDFRLQNNLSDPKHFQEWLMRNGGDYASFHSQVVTRFKREKLKTLVTEPKIQEYFIERKIFLDRVVLSRIVINDKELAEELRIQLEEGAAFDELAREYSITEDRMLNGMIGPISRGILPDVLRAAVDAANPRDIIGPLPLEKTWILFRVEHFIPASLDDPEVQKALQNELFERWIAQKSQKLVAKLQVI